MEPTGTKHIAQEALPAFTATASDYTVKRPWWAISDLSKKAWAILTAGAAVTFVSSFAASIFVAPPILGTVAAVSAVGLGVLLGVGAFEKLRSSHILPPYLQSIADSIHAHAVEVLCILGCAFLYPLAIFRKDPELKPSKQNVPVLLVHGYLHNSSGWAYMAARLKHAKVGPIYTINLGRPITTKSISEYAELVQAKVDAIAKATGQDKVVVIGHSMGGVVSAKAAVTHDHNENMDLLFTIASPLHGTRLAYVGAGECAKEMRPVANNKFLSELHEELPRLHRKLHNFASRADLIVPDEAALIEGCVHHVFADLGHLSASWSDRIIDEIICIYHNKYRNSTRASPKGSVKVEQPASQKPHPVKKKRAAKPLLPKDRYVCDVPKLRPARQVTRPSAQPRQQ